MTETPRQLPRKLSLVTRSRCGRFYGGDGGWCAVFNRGGFAMSNTRSHCPHRRIFVLLGLLLAGPGFADAPRDRGSLDDGRQRLSVEAQRVEAQVRAAVREAQSLILRKQQDKA